MKPFKPYPCDNLTQIQQEVLNYIKQYNLIDDNTPVWKLLWRADIDPLEHEFIKKCPTLINFTKKDNLYPVVYSFTYVKNLKDKYAGKIHVDSDRRKIILIPILNCDCSETKFFNVNEKDFYIDTISGNPFDTTITDTEIIKNSAFAYTTDIDYINYELIGKFSLTQPYVIDTGVPHSISVNENSKFPRISLALRFVEDISHLFEDNF